MTITLDNYLPNPLAHLPQPTPIAHIPRTPPTLTQTHTKPVHIPEVNNLDLKAQLGSHQNLNTLGEALAAITQRYGQGQQHL